MSRKAFSMVELIFVIVILGILAAVAVPRLTATRDDAEIVKTAKNLSTIVTDIAVYYTSTSQIAPNLKDMTYVKVLDGIGWLDNHVLSAGKKCIKISLIQTKNDEGKPIHLRLEDGDDSDKYELCRKILTHRSVVELKSMRFSFINKKTGAYTMSEKGEIPLGEGQNVRW